MFMGWDMEVSPDIHTYPSNHIWFFLSTASEFSADRVDGSLTVEIADIVAGVSRWNSWLEIPISPHQEY